MERNSLLTMRHAVATAEEGVQVISCLNPRFIHTDLLHTGRTAEYLVGEIFTRLSISRTWNSRIALAATTLSTASMAATGDREKVWRDPTQRTYILQSWFNVPVRISPPILRLLTLKLRRTQNNTCVTMCAFARKPSTLIDDLA